MLTDSYDYTIRDDSLVAVTYSNAWTTILNHFPRVTMVVKQLSHVGGQVPTHVDDSAGCIYSGFDTVFLNAYLKVDIQRCSDAVVLDSRGVF